MTFAAFHIPRWVLVDLHREGDPSVELNMANVQNHNVDCDGCYGGEYNN